MRTFCRMRSSRLLIEDTKDFWCDGMNGLIHITLRYWRMRSWSSSSICLIIIIFAIHQDDVLKPEKIVRDHAWTRKTHIHQRCRVWVGIVYPSCTWVYCVWALFLIAHVVHVGYFHLDEVFGLIWKLIRYWK